MAELTKARSAVNEKVKFWLGEVAAARKREKDFRKEGKRVLDIYNGKKKESIPFNILYSNTETLVPALYNAQPRPVVQRRFKDEDPLGKLASQAGQRTLEFFGDTNSEEYASFDDVMGDAVLDALLPGRGASRVRYDAEVVGTEEGKRYVKWELVCFESLKWDRWIHGYAKKWNKVPWVAFEHDVSEEEAKELFGAANAAKLQYAERSELDTRDEEKEDADTEEDQKVCKVWEIWVRAEKKIIFVSPNFTSGYLKEEDDELKLSGFFPMPQPLRFLRKSNDLAPVALYALYENQAKELNRLSVRINRIAEAMKVRGVYDSSIGELDKVFRQDDNAMVAAENVAALTDKGGLEKAIWLVPIDKLVNVFQQLIIARQQCKQIIYEITGISDILRGASVASETATAQEIKNQWGTLRLKRLQKDVSRYARDMLRISLEIAAKKLSEKTFAGMTGLPFAQQPAIQAAQAQVAAARSQMAMMGQPVDQAALAAAVPEAAKTLSQPSWASVLATLRTDTQRMYRIDIETNSTVDLEATEDQKLMTEVLAAISQFLQGVAPLIQSGSMPFQVAQSMLLGIIRRYRFGPEIEDYIKAMKPPVPPDQGKQQAEQAKAMAEEKRAQSQFDMDMKTKQMEVAARERELAMEAEYKKKEHELKLAEMSAKIEVARIMADVKLQEANNKLHFAKEQAKIDVAKAHAMPKKPAGEGQHAAS